MFLGIDFGSRFVKIAFGNSTENVNFELFRTIDFYLNFCCVEKDKKFLKIEKLCEELNIDEKKIKKIVSTGYGRNLVNFENSVVISEIIAHYFGILQNIDFSDFIIVDIGGQDTKIISVKNRIIDDFYMNDKCAAGSGRFLENVAGILDIDISKIGELYDEPENISNTCAIFAETEIISLIVNGVSIEKIASGANYSIFSKIKNYLAKLDQKTIIFSGGLSKNFAIKYFIETELEKKVVSLENAQYFGALGSFYKGIASIEGLR